MIISEILKNPNPNFGYDASSDEYKDLVQAGIIDPAKVERSALQNAISVAGMFLTTEALIVDAPKTENDTPSLLTGGMSGMGMY